MKRKAEVLRMRKTEPRGGWNSLPQLNRVAGTLRMRRNLRDHVIQSLLFIQSFYFTGKKPEVQKQ